MLYFYFLPEKLSYAIKIILSDTHFYQNFAKGIKACSFLLFHRWKSMFFYKLDILEFDSYGNGQHSSSRFNSNGSQIRGSIAAPSPWQQAGSLGYRPAPFSIPKISQASHLQEYPIDKKGSSCRKFLTGILFTVYIALCFFIVVFVIGGPELG